MAKRIPFKVLTTAAVAATVGAAAFVPAAVANSEASFSISEVVVEKDGKNFSLALDTYLLMKGADHEFVTKEDGGFINPSFVKSSTGKVFKLTDFISARGATDDGAIEAALELLDANEELAQEVVAGSVTVGADGELDIKDPVVDPDPGVDPDPDPVTELAVESVMAINGTTVKVTFNDESVVEVELDEALEEGENTLTIEVDGVEYEVTVNYDAVAIATTAVEAFEAVEVDEITHYDHVAGVEALEETARELVAAVKDISKQAALLESIDEKAAEVAEYLTEIVDTVADATNQLDLYDALDAFWTVDSKYITRYFELKQGGADIGDVHEIQENIVEAAVTQATQKEILDDIDDAIGNLLNFRNALQTHQASFERINFSNKHLSAYMEALRDGNDLDAAYDTLTSIQEEIDLQNTILATLAVDKALKDVKRADWNAAVALVEALEDETEVVVGAGQDIESDDTDELADGTYDKEALQELLEDHDLVIKVAEARTVGALQTSLEGLADHTDADDFEAVVYTKLLSKYLTAIRNTDGDDKNTVSKINGIVADITEDEVKAVAERLEAVDGNTTKTQLHNMLKDLEAITPAYEETTGGTHVDGTFDLSIVNQDWLEQYLEGIETTSGTTVAEGFLNADLDVNWASTGGTPNHSVTDAIASIIDVIEEVNESKVVVARDLLEAATSDATAVLGALKDLLLADIVDANKDFYLAEVIAQDTNFFDGTTGGGAGNYDNSLQTIHEKIVKKGNIVAKVAGAKTASEMRTALAPFGLDDSDYRALSSALKLDVAEILLADMALGTDAEGDYDNYDEILATLEAIVNEVEAFIVTTGGAINDPQLTLGDMIDLLTNDDNRDYVIFKTFEDLSVADQDEVAEYVFDNRPEVKTPSDDPATYVSGGYKTIAAVKAAIKAGIDSLN